MTGSLLSIPTDYIGFFRSREEFFAVVMLVSTYQGASIHQIAEKASSRKPRGHKKSRDQGPRRQSGCYCYLLGFGAESGEITAELDEIAGAFQVQRLQLRVWIVKGIYNMVAGGCSDVRCMDGVIGR
jgi:hypothetical protein